MIGALLFRDFHLGYSNICWTLHSVFARSASEIKMRICVAIRKINLRAYLPVDVCVYVCVTDECTRIQLT